LIDSCWFTSLVSLIDSCWFTSLVSLIDTVDLPLWYLQTDQDIFVLLFNHYRHCRHRRHSCHHCHLNRCLFDHYYW
jgi:hypothetical protein